MSVVGCSALVVNPTWPPTEGSAEGERDGASLELHVSQWTVSASLGGLTVSRPLAASSACTSPR